MRVREKVVCYVVRDGRLLVLRHLDQEWDESGLQVPAGSIEPGEPLESAALRETREETGLDPSDGGEPVRFECYWVPLAQGHVLSGGQGALLGRLAAGEVAQ